MSARAREGVDEQLETQRHQFVGDMARGLARQTWARIHWYLGDSSEEGASGEDSEPDTVSPEDRAARWEETKVFVVGFTQGYMHFNGVVAIRIRWQEEGGEAHPIAALWNPDEYDVETAALPDEAVDGATHYEESFPFVGGQGPDATILMDLYVR